MDRLYSCNPSAQDSSITDTCRPCGCKRANLPDQIGLRYSRMSSVLPMLLANDAKALSGRFAGLLEY
jgi:hypothetical protein